MVSLGNLSRYQTELYRERQGVDYLSRSFRATHQQPAPVYSRYLAGGDVLLKVPWGRARSYAGDGPVSLPAEHRPKCEPPILQQKGHLHFGSGAMPHPRGLPIEQLYDLTLLKRSNVRWNDELIPRPNTTQLQRQKIAFPFPAVHPLSSHMSRQAIFPTWDDPPEEPRKGQVDSSTYQGPTLPPTAPAAPDPVIVVHKTYGNFGRKEYIPQKLDSMRTPLTWPGPGFKSVPLENQFFSKHSLITNFNDTNRSATPSVGLGIQRLKKPDWMISS